MNNKVTPQEIIALIESLPDADKHIWFEDDQYWITQEWLCGNFAGRAFVADTKDEAAQLLIDYLYEHIGHDSIVGDNVTNSGFPNLDMVKEYCRHQNNAEE